MADDKPKIAKAGILLCLDSGEYSDYSVTGFFVVLRDFDPMESLRAFVGEDSEDYGFEHEAFVAELIRNGLLLEIQYGTLFLGSYHQASSVEFMPAWSKHG